jgi:hypothetical protein
VTGPHFLYLRGADNFRNSLGWRRVAPAPASDDRDSLHEEVVALYCVAFTAVMVRLHEVKTSLNVLSVGLNVLNVGLDVLKVGLHATNACLNSFEANT